jgi:hypothetical protein
MGYTHFWRRPAIIEKGIYDSIVADFKKLLPPLEAAGVRIAGPNGDGDPIIRPESIRFNGLSACGHLKNFEIGIAWPAEQASGIAGFTEDPISGGWFAGTKLSKRACGGDCSHESFCFDRAYTPYNDEDLPENGLYFEFCKTFYKPYDLVAEVLLVIAKHYLGSSLQVTSDGTQLQWMDAMLLCESNLGYGLGFSLDS